MNFGIESYYEQRINFFSSIYRSSFINNLEESDLDKNPYAQRIVTKEKQKQHPRK